MKFFVRNIEEYSAKSNRVTLEFVNTGTILDGCSIQIFTPKFVHLKVNQINIIPYFICNNIWGPLMWHHNRDLQMQVKAKAPRGKKKLEAVKVYSILMMLRELNTSDDHWEDPRQVKELGNFIGCHGSKLLTTLTILSFKDGNYTSIKARDDFGNYFSFWAYPNQSKYPFFQEAFEKKRKIQVIATQGSQFTAMNGFDSGGISNEFDDEETVYHIKFNNLLYIRPLGFIE